MQPIAIGISDFKKLRHTGSYFVDKSLLIKDVIEDQSDVILLPRPRRFGKTLNMTMLKYFFEKTDQADENRALFDGLQIEQEACLESHFNHYPVIFLSFKEIKSTCFELSFDLIKRNISKEFSRHAYLDDNLEPNSTRSRGFHSILNLGGCGSDYALSLRFLCELLYTFHGVKPIIIIDEYDTPIHNAYINGFYKEMVNFMKTFLGEGLKDNPFLHKSIVTGIFRVSKESIFSDLNNINVYSILRTEYTDKFGFTQSEVDKMLVDYAISDQSENVKTWYNGYLFGNQVIYNPWSILNYVDSDDKVFRTHWANTSSNEVLRDLLKNSPMDVKTKLECLLRGETIESLIGENIVFDDIESDDVTIFSFLLFSGYLKARSIGRLHDEILYEVSIPNTEVAIIMRRTVMSWFKDTRQSEKLRMMLKALVEDYIPEFAKILNNFVVETLSYFDTAGKDEEKVYQAFILGMLLNLTDTHVVTSNRESGYGRYDITVVPKNTKQRAFIMELKKIDDYHEETKDEALDNALKQIEDKQYEVSIRQLGITEITKLGVVFDGKKLWVKKAN